MKLVIDIEKAVPLLGIIEIIKVPSGEAPLKIRSCWVGVQMPYLHFDSRNNFMGILTNERPDTHHEAYVVLQKHAIEALKEYKRPDALSWWEREGFPENPHALFSFRKEEVKIIKPSDFSMKDFRY